MPVPHVDEGDRTMKTRTQLGIALIVLAIVVGVAAAIGLLLWPGDRSDGRTTEENRRQEGLSLSEVQEDYDRAVSVMLRRHPLLYSSEEKLRAIAKRRKALLHDGMSSLELYRTLAPVVEALECGHSNLQMGKEYTQQLGEDAALLPLHVDMEGNDLVVRESWIPEKVPRGSRILAINGIPGEQIISTLMAGVTSDGTNRTSKVAKINGQFAYYYHLLLDESDSFQLRFRGPGGGPETTEPLAGTNAENLFGPESALSSIGLYMNIPEMRYDFAREVTGEGAYLRVGSFILDQREFARFLEEFFREVAEAGSPQLTVDLRGNWGGPPRGSALLYSYLIEKPGPYLDENAPFYFARYKRPQESKETAFTGKLTVLVDGAVFSTTAHLVSLLEHHGRGELVGETTGGSAACTDSSRRLRLRNSGLRLYYATRVYSTPAPKQRDGGGINPSAAG